MATGRHRADALNGGEASVERALLFEVAGNKHSDQEKERRTLRIAALSLEETIRYIRNRYSDFDIAEIKVAGCIEVLSSSEHLE